LAGKPKISMYWAASCGGCEISLVNIHERIIALDSAFDLVFCPCLMDTKKKDVEAFPDGYIDICLFNGAIMTDENREMAHLLRKKSKVLIAYGSCACEGCIPALANIKKTADYLDDIYLDNPTVDNPEGRLPSTSAEVPEGTLGLPGFHARARTLSQTTDVDYFIPGCPPESERISEIVDLLISGAELPPKGSVIGAGNSIVCDECSRKKEEKHISRIYRVFEKETDPEKCLLEQGLLCMGVATRNGCGALCPQVNMPCTGCYGAPEGVMDQGARMAAAVGSILDIGETKGISEEELARRIDDILSALPDFAGTFYKYSLAAGILGERTK